MSLSQSFVLVDLDGTLVDSAPGILASFRHALAELGQPVPEAKDLGWVIGPPLRRSFAQLLGDAELAEQAVTLYRAHYRSDGLFDARVYDGIPQALDRLAEAGHRLILCTAKPWPFAEEVLTHFGLRDAFDAVYGAEFDGRFDDKGELIAHLLTHEGLSAEKGVMVGDRDNDTLSAARNDMASIGVLWGFGDAEELTKGKATALCATPADLPEAVADLLGR